MRRSTWRVSWVPIWQDGGRDWGISEQGLEAGARPRAVKTGRRVLSSPEKTWYCVLESLTPNP